MFDFTFINIIACGCFQQDHIVTESDAWFASFCHFLMFVDLLITSNLIKGIRVRLSDPFLVDDKNTNKTGQILNLVSS